MTNGKQFLLNLVTSYSHTLITALISFCSVPIALNYWGTEVYGIWTILISFSVYIAASGLGIDSATGILMTKNIDKGNKLGILKKGLSLMIVCMVFAFFVLIGLYYIAPAWVNCFGKMSEHTYSVIHNAVYIFFLFVILNMPFSVISCSYQAFGYAFLNTCFNTSYQIVSFVLILCTVKLGLDFFAYVLILGCLQLAVNIIRVFVLAHLIRKRDNELRIFEASKDNSYFKVFQTGINLSLYGIPVLLIPNISNLIISNNLSVASVVPYSLSYKLYFTAMSVVVSFNIATSPLLGCEYGKKNWEWIGGQYKKMYYVTVFFSSCISIALILLNKFVVYLWTGSLDNYPGNWVSSILGVFFIMYCLNNLNMVILNSFNYVSKIWIVSWGEGAVFLVCSFLLIGRLGVLAVPIGLCLGGAFVSLWAYPYIIYVRSKQRLIYDFGFLACASCIVVFAIMSIFLINSLGVTFLMEFIISFLCMIILCLLMCISLPKDIKKQIINSLRRKIIS